jgi:hypothetical protein
MHVPGHAEESLNVHGMGDLAGAEDPRRPRTKRGPEEIIGDASCCPAQDFISRPGGAGWSRLDGQEARAATCSRPRNPSASFPIC